MQDLVQATGSRSANAAGGLGVNVFQMASTARWLGEETADRLFVGRVEPHDEERPWLMIHGTGAASVVVTAEQGLTISIERP